MAIEVRRITEETFPEVEPLLAAYQRFYEVDDIDPERNREFFGRFVGKRGRPVLFLARPAPPGASQRPDSSPATPCLAVRSRP